MIKGEAKEAKAFVPDEIIVKFKSDKKVVSAMTTQVRGVKSIAPAFKKKTAASIDKIYRVKLEKNTNVEDTIKKFKADPDVEYAEPNLIMKVQMIPNDPFYASRGSWRQPYDDLWGLKPDKMDAEHAWDISQGEGAVVAVIDTGVDYAHPDLAANIWVNPGEDLNRNGIAEPSDLNGIDDDQNGYVDDIRGWNFGSDGNNPMDGNGHGTHVAGTIAAVGNNGQGIIGVAPRAKIMALKGLDDNGSGTILILAQAVIYAADNGAHISNSSWGGPGSSQTLTDVFDYAASRGVLNFAAAGNESEDASGHTPAGIPGVIAVGASTEKDERASFSNFGSKVEVAAPGGGYENELGTGRDDRYNILSSGVRFLRQNLRVAEGYYRLAGTSMACPHAAGAAALLKSKYPGESNEEIHTRLIATLDQTPSTPAAPFPGRINANKALNILPQPFFRLQDVRLRVRAGDDDLVPETGEEIEVVVELENIWRDAASVTLELRPPPGAGAILSSEAELGGMKNKEAKDNSSHPFVFKVGNYGDCPLSAPFILRVRTESNEQFVEVPVTLGFVKLRWDVDTQPSKIAFSGDHVAWDDARSQMSLMVYSLRTQRVTSLSLPDTLDVSPAISGAKIVWKRFPNGGDGNPQIFARDLANDSMEQITHYPELRWITPPQIDGDRIAWYTESRDDRSLHYFDPATGEDNVIFNNTENTTAIWPVISGNHVVWLQFNYSGSTNEKLFYDYNIQTGQTRVLSRIASEGVSLPEIDGNHVVWSDSRSGRFQVYLYRLNAGAETQITNDDGDHIDPHVSGNFVVWVGYQNGQWDIYAYDINHGRERRITFTPEIEFKPRISGDKIVWGNAAHEIHMTQLPSFNRPPVFHPIPPQTVVEGDTLSFVLSAEDPDGDALVYRMTGSPPPLSILYAVDHRFVWATGVGHEGNHTADFTVTDGEFTQSQTVNITVTPICPFTSNLIFVYRQYLDLLHRMWDPAAGQSWATELDTGRLTRPGLVLNFINGIEFTQNESFVIRAYSLLGRLADKQGFLSWNAELKSGRVSKEGMANAFITSSEFVTRYGTLSNRDFVRRLYLNVLRREPDAAGWNGWTSVLDNQTYTRAQVALQFLTSPEAGTKNSNRDFIQALYLCLLQRQAADAEFNNWLSLLSDRYGRVQAISAFLNSLEYQSRLNCT